MRLRYLFNAYNKSVRSSPIYIFKTSLSPLSDNPVSIRGVLIECVLSFPESSYAMGGRMDNH